VCGVSAAESGKGDNRCGSKLTESAMTGWNGMPQDAAASAAGGWNRQVLRAYVPAALCWFAATLALIWRERVQAGVATIELASALQWSVIVLLLATVAHGGWVSWRLWQARHASA